MRDLYWPTEKQMTRLEP